MTLSTERLIALMWTILPIMTGIMYAFTDGGRTTALIASLSFTVLAIATPMLLHKERAQ